MKKHFLFLIFIFSNSICFSQITFQTIFGDTVSAGGISGQQTKDGGYIIVGECGSSDFNGCLIKTDSFGNVLWTKFYDTGPDSYDFFGEPTNDIGYIAGGFSIGVGGKNYLVQTNSDGDTLWTRDFYVNNGSSFKAIKHTYDNGFIILGSTFDDDIYLLKIDSAGSPVLIKCYSGNVLKYLTSIELTADSGFIIPGFKSIIKFDALSNITWIKTYNDIYVNRVKQTSDGGYIIQADDSTANPKIILTKTDSVGSVSWSKTYGGGYYQSGKSVQQTADKGFIIGADMYDVNGICDVYLIKTDSVGNLVWSKAYGKRGALIDNDYCYSVNQTMDGGYFVVGLTIEGNIPAIYLIKTGKDGNSGGCNEYMTSTTEQSLTINSATDGYAFKPATLIMTNDSLMNVGSKGVGRTLCTNVGVNNLMTTNATSVFPNPSSFQMTISSTSFSENETIIISLTNTLGEVVRSEERIWKQDFTLDIRTLPTGIYFLKITDWKKECIVKVVKLTP